MFGGFTGTFREGGARRAPAVPCLACSYHAVEYLREPPVRPPPMHLHRHCSDAQRIQTDANNQ